jgi:hypothetical protein
MQKHKNQNPCGWHALSWWYARLSIVELKAFNPSIDELISHLKGLIGILKLFAVIVYRVGALTLVGVPLMVQVVLLILKPAGSVGATGTGAPSGSGYTKIYSTGSSFAAIKADGSITTWGLLRHAGIVVSAPNLANAEYQAAVIGSAITDITFSNSGGAITSCTVAPTTTGNRTT